MPLAQSCSYDAFRLENDVHRLVREVIAEHVHSLKESLDCYFPGHEGPRIGNRSYLRPFRAAVMDDLRGIDERSIRLDLTNIPGSAVPRDPV